MIEYWQNCFFYSLPVLLSGIFFILTLKQGYFGFLKKPLSLRLFGANKTYLGFVLMPLYCLLFTFLLSLVLKNDNELYLAQNLYKSLSLGLFYPLGELPNSFIKRQLSIAAGKNAPSSGLKAIFFVLDNIDSVLACSLCLVFIYGVSLIFVPGILILGSTFHFSTDCLMFKLKLKQPPAAQ